MSVTFVDSVLTKLRAAAEPGIFLVVRLEGRPDPREVLTQVREAVAVANAATAPDTVQGGYTTSTPRGCAIHLHAAPVVNTRQRAAVRGWLTTCTDQLTAGGLSGKVGTSGTWGPDLDSLLPTGRTHPAAFVGYRLENYAPWGEMFRGWQVAAETTRLVAEQIQSHASSIADARSWAALAGPSVPIPTREIAKYFTSTAALVRDQKSVYLHSEGKSAFERYSLSSHGQCVTQAVDRRRDWRSLLDAQLQFLLMAPEAVDVGMVKNTWELASAWSDTNVRDYHAPVRDPLDYQLNRHLWDEYVIDAAGVSLLTGKHLKHARDLSDWTIEEVAPDRFLVSARDLEPWFGGIAAPPAIIDRARADFGDMILSWDTILSKPGPYTIISPSIVGR